MALEVANVDVKAGVVIRVTQKARVLAKAVLSPTSIALMRDYLAERRPARFVFEQRDGRHYHRTWPNETLRKACGALGLSGISPRAFRRTLATNWDGDAIKELQVQAGWKDVKTIFTHYRQAVDERQRAAAHRAQGVKEDQEDIAGYG